jgi:hypothetical protein
VLGVSRLNVSRNGGAAFGTSTIGVAEPDRLAVPPEAGAERSPTESTEDALRCTTAPVADPPLLAEPDIPRLAKAGENGPDTASATETVRTLARMIHQPRRGRGARRLTPPELGNVVTAQPGEVPQIAGRPPGGR